MENIAYFVTKLSALSQRDILTDPSAIGFKILPDWAEYCYLDGDGYEIVIKVSK